MHFRVLGPLQVVEEDGRSLVLGGPKQRAVLALLLMEANRPVSKDRLIDAMWGEHPPVSASETLDTYISRLRRILGPDRLARRPAGYELRVDAGELDLTTFDELVSEAEQLLPEDPNAAAAIFRKALALWNGDPIGDLRYELSMTGITDQLAERHLAALERQAEADLAAGNGPRTGPRTGALGARPSHTRAPGGPPHVGPLPRWPTVGRLVRYAVVPTSFIPGARAPAGPGAPPAGAAHP